MGDAAPSEAGAPPEERRSFLHRVPTSLVVTLVGIALTAWLLPAFTRQWDDRQKAQELRGATIQTLNSEFARMYVASRRVFRTTSTNRTLPTDPAETVLTDPVAYKLLDQWTVAWIPIQARASTYFPGLRPDFTAFARVVAELGFLASSPGSDPLHSVRAMRDQYGLKISDKDYRQIEASLRTPGDSPHAQVQRSDGFETLVGLIQDKMEVLDAEVLRAHVRGYSTSGQDLLHNLIP